MKTLPLVALITLALISNCCFSTPFALAEEDLWVEGVVFESKNPAESLAVVNGVPLKKGDVIQDYTIKEIKETTVVFTAKNGQEKTVSLLGAKPKPTAPLPAAPEAVPQKKDAEKKEPAKSPFDLSGIMDKVASMSVLIDLKNLQMQVMSYYAQNGDVPTVKSMVESGDLNPAFGTGVKGNYKFSIKKGSNGDPLISADPVKEDSKLSHFLIDEWGNVRTEKGKPADSKSEIYQG